MELVKIYKDEDFANAVIPEGAVLTYTAVEEGKVVTKFRDEKGEIGIIAGGNTEPPEPQIEYKGGYFINNEDGTLTFMEVNEDTTTAEGIVTDVNIVDTGVDEPLYNTAKADVTLGQVDADGNFQPLAFNGLEVSNSGNPETVENYYGWNGVLPVPNGGIRVGGSDYYKCASVDTTNKTWSGYKAVLTDGVYSFEENATTGLEYSNGYIPVVGGIYDQSTTVKVTKLYDGSEYPIPREGLLFYAPLQTDYIDVISGKSAKQTGGDFTVHNGVNCLYLDGSEYIEWGDMTKNASEYTLLLLVCPTDLYEWRSFIQLSGDDGHIDIAAKNGHLKEWGGEYMVESVWQTVAVAITQDKYGRAYLNGMLNGTSNGQSDYPTTINSITIGSNKSEGYNHKVEGYVAFAAVYNRVLSDTEITDIHNELMSNINE